MDPIVEASRESRLLRQGLNLSFSFLFRVYHYTFVEIGPLLCRRSSYKLMLAVTCSSRDFAFDGVFFIT